MGKKFSILFDSFHLYHLPQFEPLIDLLSNDDRFQIYHSTSRQIQNSKVQRGSFLENLYSSFEHFLKMGKREELGLIHLAQ